MYQILLFSHNYTRWLLLASLLLMTCRAYRGYYSKLVFLTFDTSLSRSTVAIAHTQLTIGMTLYFQSPLIKYFFSNFSSAIQDFDMLFFGMIHSTLMLISVIFITIGSAIAKRKETSSAKFKAIIIWFSLALIVITIAIPWPFSPFSNRPYFR